MFTAYDYQILHNLVFRDDYPGYRREVVESPNGDGKWDREKKYAHVALKYLEKDKLPAIDLTGRPTLEDYLRKATYEATNVAIQLGVPKAFWPTVEYSALRILEYPPGSNSHRHTDFDLFTLMCYRNIPELFKYSEAPSNHLLNANKLNEQIHFGEMLQIINPNYTATPHHVNSDGYRTQYSIIFFAIPDHKAVLPSGVPVGEWLEERMSRSRSEAA